MLAAKAGGTLREGIRDETARVHNAAWRFGRLVPAARRRAGRDCCALTAHRLSNLEPYLDKPSPERAAFLEGLRELGYIDGKTIQIEYSSANSFPELLPEAAEALVEQGVDLIAATGVVPALAAKQATQTIPVVFTYVADPVGNGLVASLARPEGNVTGLSAMQPELAGKKVELLKEVLPALSRVAALWTSAHPAHMRELEEAQAAARRLGVLA